MPKLTNQERKAIYRALGLITQMGVCAAMCVGMGIFIGWFLDRWLGTTPWLIMLFTLLGCFAAIKTMYDMAKRVYK